jgi:uncharacterized membrane protein
MKCPVCGVLNPDNAVMCGCGYKLALQTKVLYYSFTYMGVGGFFSNSLRTYGVAWTTFLLLGVIYTFVEAMPEILPYPGVAAGVVYTVISLIVPILTTMALIITAHRTSEGEAIGIRDSYALSLRFFWRYTWTWILYFLIVLGGVILLIVPGIIWGVRYSLAPYAVIIENLGAKQALSRSRALTKGKGFSIFWHELRLGSLFLLLITLSLGLLTSLIAAVLGQPFPGLPSSPNPEWAGVVRGFGEATSVSLYLIFNVLLFKSLRLEKD